jgi:hypothetical protein
LSRFPSALALALLAGGAPAGAEAVLDVAGAVVSVAPRLEVRVVVTNRGDRLAVPLEIAGELLGERQEARLADGIAPGSEGAVVLAFTPPGGARPGTHALILLLEHPVEGAPDAGGNSPVASQRAWLLLALGANPKEPVRLYANPLRLDVEGHLGVRLDSADGEPHRVRLRAFAARGLRAEGSPALVEVPARGTASAALGLVRAGAARGTHHAVLLVAESLDGPLARTAVATAPVDIEADPSLLPRLRPTVLVVGLLLVAVALAFEGLRARRT